MKENNNTKKFSIRKEELAHDIGKIFEVLHLLNDAIGAISLRLDKLEGEPEESKLLLP